MYTAIVRDENGNEFVVPKSHKNTADALRAIAEAKIKVYGLDCTVEEYWERSKEKQDESSSSL